VSRLVIASAAYPVELISSLRGYFDKLTSWCEAAARSGAQLLVFPEYGAMEACGIFGETAARDLTGSTIRLQEILPDIDERLSALAERLGVIILGPSAPRSRTADGSPPWTNTARLFLPDGRTASQEKLILTPWDISPWGLSAGCGQTVFETDVGRIGIAICYDVEFPLLARRLAEAGADIILAPSCTDTLAGYWRVRIGAQARALENQCIAVQSPTVGAAGWSPALDINRGAAGVFAPPDRGMPQDGVLALGGLDEPGWTFASVNMDAVRALRAEGEVRTFTDWNRQGSAMAPPEPQA